MKKNKKELVRQLDQIDKEYIKSSELRREIGIRRINLLVENSLYPSKDKEEKLKELDRKFTETDQKLKEMVENAKLILENNKTLIFRDKNPSQKARLEPSLFKN